MKSSLIRLAVGALLAVGLSAHAADPSGTWKWSQPGRNGGAPRESTLTLKLDGTKLTGSLSAPGRGGAAATPVNITDGSVKGDEVAFSVVREGQNGSITNKFSGKLSGDTITGKSEGMRQGQPTSTDWVAKKEGAKAEPAK